MNASLNYIYRITSWLLYGFCAVGLTLSSEMENHEGILIYLITGVLLLRTVMLGHSDSLRITVLIITIFLFAIPATAIYALLRINVLPVLVAFIIFSDLLIVLNRGLAHDVEDEPSMFASGSQKKSKIVLFLLLTWCALAGIFIKAEGFWGLLLFFSPFAASLVYFDLIILQRNSRWLLIAIFLLYIFVIMSYIVFQWSGYGRIVIASFILSPLLIINSRIDLGLRPIYFMLAAPFALFVAQASRYGEISDPEQIFIGSAGHHLLVTHDVMQRSDHVYYGGVDVFFEQYLLFFLNWFPREFWPDKPEGIGLWSVDVIYGRAGYGEGYSHSIGFVGEQYFYLGDWFGTGLFVMLLTLAFTRTMLRRLSFGFTVPVVLFDVSLVSYFWGGGATFGSRFWFLTVPALLVCWYLNSQLRQKKPRRVLIAETHAGSR